MNNLTVGNDRFTYYETMGGGAGAGPDGAGASAIQTHMTNTRNTPIEALENATPLLVRRLRIAIGSGGEGRHRGGEGLCRRIEFRERCLVHLLADRRERGAAGAEGGGDGQPGEDRLFRCTEGTWTRVPGRARIEVEPGDQLEIRTPGGGGFGTGV